MCVGASGVKLLNGFCGSGGGLGGLISWIYLWVALF